MKLTALKHSRNRHRKAPSIALFPFLAVLICTMGALVPLLLGIARQARMQATQAAKVKAARQHLDLQADREAVTWRVEQLKTARQATEEQLKSARFKLGHLEDHARRLRRQAADLEAAWNDLQGADSQAASQRNGLEAEGQRLESQLAAAERELADAKRDATHRQPSYAILPFDGKNKTRRRPIYIECTDEAVILQPEGIRLGAHDFFGPMGPGNPLAASLRAIREYWVTSGGFDAEKDGEPYALLLVRPGGALAYYCALEAIDSWGKDFGYEMIEENWKLQFPQADARLAMVVERTLDKARIDQQRLIARAPRAYDKPKPVFQVPPTSGGARRVDSGRGERSPVMARSTGAVGRRYGGAGGASGGSETEGGDAYGGGPVGGRPGSRQSGTGQGGGSRSGMSESESLASLYGGIAARGTAGAGSVPTGGGGYGPGGTVSGPGGYAVASAGGGYGPGGAGAGGPGYGPAGAGGGYAVASAGGGYGPGAAGAGGPGYGPAGAGGGNGPGGAGSGGPGYGPAGTGGEGGGSLAGGGQPSDTGTAASGTPGVGGVAGGSLILGDPKGGTGGGTSQGNCPPGGNPNGGTSPGNSTGQPLTAGSTAGSIARPEGYVAGRPANQDLAQNTTTPPVAGQQMAAPLRPGEWREPPPPLDKPPEPPKDKAKEKDKKKPERDLAKNREHDWALRYAATGSTPVSRPIRVDCYHDQVVISPGRSSRVVPMPGRTDQALDGVVSAVWAEMESWGIAGRGMYWRPILQTQVAPGGEQRFQDLQRLLEGSGLTLEKR